MVIFIKYTIRYPQTQLTGLLNYKKDIKKDLDIFSYFFPICGRIKYVFFTKTKTYHINCVSTTHRKDLL